MSELSFEESLDLEFQDTSELKVIYIVNVGVDSEGFNIYHFLIGRDTADVWQEGWEEVPACNMTGLQPPEDTYEYIKELRTTLKFNLAQNNCCFSFSDCKDRCVAMAIEDINDYEEYPEPLRIVIQFGETLENVEKMLAKRDLRIKYI